MQEEQLLRGTEDGGVAEDDPDQRSSRDRDGCAVEVAIKSSSRDSDGGVAVDWGKDGQSCCDEGDDDREGIGEEMMM